MPCAQRPLQPGDAGPAAQGRADAIADRDFLMRALARLPARQRTVLVLRYFNDLSEEAWVKLTFVRGAVIPLVNSRG